jgi:hypothetical protein
LEEAIDQFNSSIEQTEEKIKLEKEQETEPKHVNK